MIRISILFFFLFACASNNNKEQEEERTQEVKYLALGDSYTIGESGAENMRWPIQLADSLMQRQDSKIETKIIATTGWRTDDLAKAILEENLNADYDMVSLLIGVNNQYQGRQ